MKKALFSNLLILPLFSLFFYVACNKKEEKENSKVIARAFDKYLYAEDISGLIVVGTTANDSTLLTQKYINNWVREVLLLKKAEKNLTAEQKNVDKQIEDYKTSLITYIYEKELVKQSLDTIVTDDEIAKYYNDNKNNFELKKNIIKVIYVKVNKKVPDIEKLKKWYKSDLVKDKETLQGYCNKYAENFYLDENTWLLFDDILKEVPIQTYNQESFLQYNRFVEVADSASLYFLNIKGFQIKNSLSPIAFEREKITSILLNKRKVELINKMKQDIFDEAINEKNVEIF